LWYWFSEYRYFNSKTLGLDFEGMCTDLKSAPSGSVILLHACAHNPTGVDPTLQEWEKLRDIIKSKNHITFFDCAYQGFASGSLDQDAQSVRLFARDGMTLLISQSFAKNFGLYSERTGAFSIVLGDGHHNNSINVVVDNVRSQLKTIIRPMYSNPPGHGAKIISKVLGDPQLYQEWQSHLKEMSGRIQEMRTKLYETLKNKKTPGDWSHIIHQIGMFSYTGLNETQVEKLTREYHIYMVKNGRISMAGLNSKNVTYFANAIHNVITGDNSKL